MAETALRRHIPGVHTRIVARLLLLGSALIVALALAMMVGTVTISPQETGQILLYKLGLYGNHATWPSTDQAIVWEIRLPRVMAAALVGAALGTAGTLFQAVLRNPLADPYVIGTSAGAQLGVAIAFLFPVQIVFLRFGPLQVLAFAGALLTVLFVYTLARTGGRTAVVTLLLAGFVVSSFLISGTTFLMMAGNRMNEVMTWTMGGGIDVTDLAQLAGVGPLILAAVFAAYLLAARLDVLLLGEEHAMHLGIRVERLKLGAIVLASLLTGLAVALAGIVAFVGLVVPHTARMIFGPGHRLLVPTSAAGGALFLVLADALARVVLRPTVVPLGVITAVVGAPFFLHLLRRARRDYAL